MTTHPFARISCLSILLSQLQACTGIGEVSGEMPLRIETIPSGATVYIMEKAVGKTPMEITQSQLYPPAYDASKKGHYGNITIRKTECEDYTQRVKYQEFSNGLKIELACGEFSAKPVKTEQVQTKHSDPENRPIVKKEQIEEQTNVVNNSADKGSQNISEASIKQRLLRLDSLHQESLISDEEYQSARKKILSEL
ncbi:MAG: PEGA domain-containing protein [Candidatus Thiodiazotropha sp. L084R]